MCWLRLARELSGQFDVIMVDARGHGESSRVAADRPYDAGEDLAQAIEALELTEAALIGHSVGARAAARCASIIPGKVTKLILEDPPLLPPISASERRKRIDSLRERLSTFETLSLAEITASGRAQSPDWHEEDFPAWSAAKKQFDPEAYPAWSRPWQEVMAEVPVPSLLVYGETDRGSLAPPSAVEELKGLNDRFHCVQIIGAGHNIRRERFTDYLSVVRQFLQTP